MQKDSINFVGLKIDRQEVGKIVKNSKKQIVWNFRVNNKLCFLIFQYSKFTGKFQIQMNDKMIYKGIHNSQKEFIFKFVLEKLNCFIRKEKEFMFYIENFPFEDFMMKKSETGMQTSLLSSQN